MKRLFCLLMMSFTSPYAISDDVEDRLSWFLEHVNCEATHQSFWSETLIYTSSAGSRFGKSQIVDSMSGCDDSSDVHYGATNTTVRYLGEVALLTFELVMFEGNRTEPSQRFYNSGVLIEENGEWRATLWQATKINNNASD